MDGLTALLAGLLATLRTAAPNACPGNWAWGVTLFGIAVGLLPTIGIVVVALLRRRIGSRYGAPESAVLVGTGIVTCGLLPLLIYIATGRVFVTAFAGQPVDGLTRAQQNTLGLAQCVTGNPARYLGAGSVADSFGESPARFVLSAVLLVALPLAAALFVGAQARIVLRRGPQWPVKFFWLPVLAVAFTTAGVPAGTAGHLWIGFAMAAALGIGVAALCGAPSADALRRLRAPAPARPPAGQPSSGYRPPPAGPVRTSPVPPGPRTGRPPLGGSSTGTAVSSPRPTLVGAVPTFGTTSTARSASPRFRVVRKLGSGGFGRVWLAQDAKLGHLVALKSAHAPDAETEERIRREAQALAAIRHPHCVRIYDMLPARSDAGLADLDGMVIVMGYVDGPSLGELVRTQGTLDDIAAARVWLSVAGALDAAHRRGVMHRDVKPGNVIVDAGGLAHLIDFGIARRTGDATMTQAGFVLGTPDFLAPEIACGDRATPASDGWQLAATVSYALTGHPPRGTHQDAVSGLRAAAAGAALTHLPQRTAHLALLRATLDTTPSRRPPLTEVQSALSQWLRRSGVALDGPVTATGVRTR